MKDQAGAEIVVGCRVAEANFSYGDGLVESVTVPCAGGCFNVGVTWDDPEKGGPEWSADGGGRSSEHLLVIEPPAQAVAGDTGSTRLPPREFSAFHQRFGRSPTPSEAELGEEDWSDIEDERGEQPAAAAVATAETIGGGSGGGGDDEGWPPLPDWLVTGAQVKLCMLGAQPPAFYGALVGLEQEGGFWFGFDDGE